nr:hypothetical protein [Serinicoccus sp. CNJ-927]
MPGAPGEQHVGRLDVPVQNARLVGRGERGGHLRPDRRDLGRGQPLPVGDQLGQRGTRDELHDDPGRPVVLEGVVDAHDVLVRERGAGPRLAETAAEQQLGVGLAGDLLERDLPAEVLVGRQPHLAAAAPAEHADDAVTARDQGGVLVGGGRCRRLGVVVAVVVAGIRHGRLRSAQG